MKYLCLVYSEEKILNAMPKDDSDSFIDEHLALREELENSGHSIQAEALQTVQNATTIRVRNNKVSITDGPFAETKEQLTGFYYVNARDLNEAIQIAAKIPAARIGSVEVRPIRDLVAERRSGS
ncbi:YciI family protein [bacterium]|nr:YciI family protein [bacterium]MCI0605398.1 YciI family protein [bacterium]